MIDEEGSSWRFPICPDPCTLDVRLHTDCRLDYAEVPGDTVSQMKGWSPRCGADDLGNTVC